MRRLATLATIIGAIAPFTASAQPVTWPDVGRFESRSSDGRSDAAVVVGIGRYALVPHVAGAADNARDWYRYLTVARGVPESQVRLLVDNEGTVEKIRKAVLEATTRVRSGGRLWFVFIGHGAPALDGSDGVLVGFDAQQEADSLSARSLPRAELLQLLAKAPAGVSSVAILDACFSGRTASGSSLAPNLQPLVVVRERKAEAADRTILLTAGTASQLAGPLPGLDRPGFSYLLLGALRGWADADRDGTVTPREATRYVGDVMQAVLTDRTQTPTMSGPESMALATSAKERGPSIASIVSKEPMSAPSAPTIAMHRIALENGLTVLLLPMTATREWTVRLTFRGGSVLDPVGRSGLAHLVEHLSFDAKMPSGESIVDALRRIDASFNGITDWEHSAFYAMTKENHIDKMLQVAAAWLSLSDRIDDTAVAGAKSVVKYEISRFGPRVRAFGEALFPPGHPYRRTTAGDANEVAALTRAELDHALRRRFSPANAILAIAGPFDVDEMKQRARQHLAPLSSSAHGRLPTPPRERIGLATPRVVEAVGDKNDRTEIEVTWPSAPQGTPDDAAFDVVAQWVSSRSSPLAKRLIEELGLVATVAANQGSYPRGSTFSISTACRPEDTSRVRAEIDAFITRSAEALDDLAVAHAREALLERAHKSLATPFGRAEWVSNVELFGLPLAPEESWGRATTADIRRVIRAMLVQKPALTTIRRPASPR